MSSVGWCIPPALASAWPSAAPSAETFHNLPESCLYWGRLDNPPLRLSCTNDQPPLHASLSNEAKWGRTVCAAKSLFLTATLAAGSCYFIESFCEVIIISFWNIRPPISKEDKHPYSRHYPPPPTHLQTTIIIKNPAYLLFIFWWLPFGRFMFWFKINYCESKHETPSTQGQH